MAWAQLTDAEDLTKVVRSNLDDLVVEFVISHELIGIVLSLTADVVHIKLLVDLGHHKIENGNDVRGVVLNLAVKHLIVLEDVIAVNVEDVSVEFTHFLQLLDVVGCFLELLVVFVIVVVLDLLKVVDEVFEFHLDIAGVDVGAPEDLGVGAHLVIGAIGQGVLIQHACGGLLVIRKVKLLGAVGVEGRLVQKTVHVQESALLRKVAHQSRSMENPR